MTTLPTMLAPLPPSVSIGAFPADHGTAWTALHGGRVNTLWRVGNLVIKQYSADGGSPLFPNDPIAEATILQNLSKTGLAPELVRTGNGYIAYRHVEGTSWKQGCTAVARLLSRLQALPITPEFNLRNAANGSASLRQHAEMVAADCRSDLPPLPRDPAVAATSPVLIHGDLVPGNIIDDGKTLTLIDWQCPAWGDPAEDIATFLSPAMQWLYRGSILSQAERAAFLSACPKTAVARYHAQASLYHWRMAAHCLWRAEQGAADYAEASKLELAML